MGLHRPLPRTGTRGRPAARPQPARGLQRLEVDRAGRGVLAHAAARLPALRGRLPANANVDQRRDLRGDGVIVDAHEPLLEEDYTLLWDLLELTAPLALTLEYDRNETALKEQLGELRDILKRQR